MTIINHNQQKKIYEKNQNQKQQVKPLTELSI